MVMMVSAAMESFLKIERTVTIEVMVNGVTANVVTGSVRAQDKGNLAEAVTIMTAEVGTTEADLAAKVQIRVGLCRRVPSRMQRSTEMKKSAELVRKKISETAKI